MQTFIPLFTYINTIPTCTHSQVKMLNKHVAEIQVHFMFNVSYSRRSAKLFKCQSIGEIWLTELIRRAFAYTAQGLGFNSQYRKEDAQMSRSRRNNFGSRTGVCTGIRGDALGKAAVLRRLSEHLPVLLTATRLHAFRTLAVLCEGLCAFRHHYTPKFTGLHWVKHTKAALSLRL